MRVDVTQTLVIGAQKRIERAQMMLDPAAYDRATPEQASNRRRAALEELASAHEFLRLVLTKLPPIDVPGGPALTMTHHPLNGKYPAAWHDIPVVLNETMTPGIVELWLDGKMLARVDVAEVAL